jgi:hypothetical protein
MQCELTRHAVEGDFKSTKWFTAGAAMHMRRMRPSGVPLNAHFRPGGKAVALFNQEQLKADTAFMPRENVAAAKYGPHRTSAGQHKLVGVFTTEPLATALAAVAADCGLTGTTWLLPTPEHAAAAKDGAEPFNVEFADDDGQPTSVRVYHEGQFVLGHVSNGVALPLAKQVQLAAVARRRCFAAKAWFTGRYLARQRPDGKGTPFVVAGEGEAPALLLLPGASTADGKKSYFNAEQTFVARHVTTNAAPLRASAQAVLDGVHAEKQFASFVWHAAEAVDALGMAKAGEAPSALLRLCDDEVHMYNDDQVAAEQTAAAWRASGGAARDRERLASLQQERGYATGEWFTAAQVAAAGRIAGAGETAVTVALNVRGDTAAVYNEAQLESAADVAAAAVLEGVLDDLCHVNPADEFREPATEAAAAVVDRAVVGHAAPLESAADVDAAAVLEVVLDDLCHQNPADECLDAATAAA